MYVPTESPACRVHVDIITPRAPLLTESNRINSINSGTTVSTLMIETFNRNRIAANTFFFMTLLI
jgi:hypothetical protein